MGDLVQVIDLCNDAAVTLDLEDQPSTFGMGHPNMAQLGLRHRLKWGKIVSQG